MSSIVDGEAPFAVCVFILLALSLGAFAMASERHDELSWEPVEGAAQGLRIQEVKGDESSSFQVRGIASWSVDGRDHLDLDVAFAELGSLSKARQFKARLTKRPAWTYWVNPARGKEKLLFRPRWAAVLAWLSAGGLGLATVVLGLLVLRRGGFPERKTGQTHQVDLFSGLWVLGGAAAGGAGLYLIFAPFARAHPDTANGGAAMTILLIFAGAMLLLIYGHLFREVFWPFLSGEKPALS